MTTPIREMIDAFPTPCVFLLGVNPGATSVSQEDIPVAPVAPAPVNAFLGRVDVQGEGSAVTTTLTVALEDVPDGVKSGETSITTAAKTYLITGIRERRWEGELDGYTYTLSG